MKVPEGVVTIHFGEKKGLKALIKALKSHGSFSKVLKVSPISHILHLLVMIVHLKMRSPEGIVTFHFGEKNALRSIIMALKSDGHFSKVFKVSPLSHRGCNDPFWREKCYQGHDKGSKKSWELFKSV